MHYLDESHITLFLAQVFILLLCTRALGLLFTRWGQPSLTAELLVGIVLGPTLLGRFVPGLHEALFPPDLVQQSMLETVAWLGVLFMLLETGLEIDFSIAWRQRGRAMTIAMADIVLPMALAFVPCLFLPGHYLVDPDRRVLFALFMATVMTISAMPVAARILHDLKLLKADVGFLIMSALAVNDVVGWVVFTLVLGFFMQSAIQLGPVLGVLLGTVGFAAFALTAGRRLAASALAAFRRNRLPEPATSFTFVCLVGLLFGALTQTLGIHALFGFFMAGVAVGGASSLSEETRGTISQMVYALFVPIFFANIGLKTDFIAGFDPLLVGFMCVLGIGGRYLGAWVGVSLTSTPRINRHLIAIAHTPGGMMEIVVALLAMESGLITPRVFVAIVFSAVFSSMLMGPWMRSAMNKREAIRVTDFLAEASLAPELASQTRDEAIRKLAAMATAQVAGLPPDRIAELALAREHELGTAVGRGVAIPHVRLDRAKHPVLAVGRSPQGIGWDAPDGLPVHFIFLLVSPTGIHDIHVQALAQICRVMQLAENQERIKQAADAHSLRDVLCEMFGAAELSPGHRV